MYRSREEVGAYVLTLVLLTLAAFSRIFAP